jgi:hypothetical protein
MSGFTTSLDTLATVAGRLRTAADAVGGVSAAPPPPRAGACTAIVNAGLGALCGQATLVVTGYLAAAETVDVTLRDYRNVDEDATIKGVS